jgi:hypothetical protein
MIVAKPRSWKDITRCDIGLANVPKSKHPYSKFKLMWCFSLGWPKLVQQQKHNWTRLVMTKDGEQQNNKNVNKEWQNNNKQ